METNNDQKSGTKLQFGAVYYAAALRRYNKYGRCRLMRAFCEYDGYD